MLWYFSLTLQWLELNVVLLKKGCRQNNFIRPFNLYFCWKSQSILCVHLPFATYFLWLILGRHRCYLIPSRKIFLVHPPHIKLPQQQLLVSFCMIYWEGIFFSLFWHRSIIHLSQTEDFYSTIHGQVQVRIPIQFYSGLLLKTWSFSWPFCQFCLISCLSFLLRYFLPSVSDYVYVIFSVPKRDILF